MDDRQQIMAEDCQSIMEILLHSGAQLHWQESCSLLGVVAAGLAQMASQGGVATYEQCQEIAERQFSHGLAQEVHFAVIKKS